MLNRAQSSPGPASSTGRSASIQDYASVAQTAAALLGIHVVFVAADDFPILDRFAACVAGSGLAVRWIPAEAFATGRRHVSHIDRYLQKWYQRPDAGTTDEGLTLLAAIALMAEARMVVGLRRSNVYCMIRKLMWRTVAPPCTYAMDDVHPAHDPES